MMVIGSGRTFGAVGDGRSWTGNRDQGCVGEVEFKRWFKRDANSWDSMKSG